MSPQRPRVIFASTVFAEGATGPATYARYLWESLRDSQVIDFHLLVPKAIEPHPRIHEYGLPAKASDHHRNICRELAKLESDFDIIHSNNAHSIAGLDSNAVVLVQLNDYEVANARRNVVANVRRKGLRKAATLLWRHQQERRCLASADLAIANSSYVRDAAIQRYGLPADKCVTLYKAVDIAAFERPVRPGEDPWPGRKEAFRMLFVGSNWEIKGLDIALEALSEILVERKDLHLLVVGSGDNSASRKIRERFSRLETEGFVSYVGRKNQLEIARYMWRATVALLPSREEALGVSVLEAMAAGLPVIGSSAGGIREILADGEYGLQFPAGNSVELRHVVERLLSSADDRQHFSSRSLERAKWFSRSAMVEKLCEIYVQSLAAK